MTTLQELVFNSPTTANHSMHCFSIIFLFYLLYSYLDMLLNDLIHVNIFYFLSFTLSLHLNSILLNSLNFFAMLPLVPTVPQNISA